MRNIECIELECLMGDRDPGGREDSPPEAENFFVHSHTKRLKSE